MEGASEADFQGSLGGAGSVNRADMMRQGVARRFTYAQIDDNGLLTGTEVLGEAWYLNPVPEH